MSQTTLIIAQVRCFALKLAAALLMDRKMGTVSRADRREIGLIIDRCRSLVETRVHFEQWMNEWRRYPPLPLCWVRSNNSETLVTSCLQRISCVWLPNSVQDNYCYQNADLCRRHCLSWRHPMSEAASQYTVLSCCALYIVVADGVIIIIIYIFISPSRQHKKRKQ